MATPFRDFIPAGEDTGAQGSGFKDFVPPSESKPVTPVEVVEAPVEEVKTAKELRDEAEALGIDIGKLKNKKALQEAIDAKKAEPVIPEVTEEPVVPVEE